ncbi:20130_t:CDS:1, partial [Racocetra persica]
YRIPDETMLLDIDWFQKVRARIHFDEQKLLFRYLGKSNEIPIIQTCEDKLEIPQEAYSSNKDDFFNTYESEDDLEEVESYHTDDISTDNEELFLNPWEDVYSPAIYLTAIEEIFTLEATKKPESTPVDFISELVKVKTLNEK